MLVIFVTMAIRERQPGSEVEASKPAFVKMGAQEAGRASGATGYTSSSEVGRFSFWHKERG